MSDLSDLRKGAFVLHQRSPSWGVGIIIALEPPAFSVLFTHAGEKKLRTPPGQELDDILLVLDPEDVPADAAIRDPARWDEVRTVGRNRSAEARAIRSLDPFFERFRAAFPGGFDARFGRAERDYKVRAGDFMRETLSPAIVSGLIAEGRASEVFQRACEVVSPTRFNPVHRFDFFKFRDVPQTAHPAFAESLLRLVTAGDDVPEALALMGSTLAMHQAAKWTVCSAFPFLADPTRWVFVKPEAVSAAAEALGLDIQYTPRPNAQTYRHIVDLYALVARRLTELGDPPRDNIDVQAFLWIGSGLGYSQVRAAETT